MKERSVQGRLSELLEKAGKLITDEMLCDQCLGRPFAQLGSGLTNAERGRALRVLYNLQHGHPCSEPERCSLCGNVFQTVPKWAERALAQTQGWEFLTYLIGTCVPAEIPQAEDVLRARYALDPDWAEPFKQAFNREVGKQLGLLLQGEGRPAMVHFLEPNITLHIDLQSDRLSLRVNPLFIYGRYRKLVRGIPQTHWPCRSCQGWGCPQCNDTGRQYPESVEELIADPVLAATEGRGARLHGAGREDIDARMLGDGRPFVLELLEPRRRRIDLRALERAINEGACGKVEVARLKVVSRTLIARIKQTKVEKIYQALVTFEHPIAPEKLARALRGLFGVIEQRTPQRVSHRRPDRVRRRCVLQLEGRLIAARQASLKIHCEGGLYIKELVSGDAGRTRPSLSALLGTAAEVVELDVLEVCADFEEDAGESRVGHASSF